MEKVIHIIPTPIGNLEDITIRAIQLLKDSDLVLAEDTRKTKKLFIRYEIPTKLSSYHMFNEHKKIDSVINLINKGSKISLVSDAGTPGISDPGFLLIRECIKNNINVICLPGPTACIPALIQSGLPCNKFHFEGFLPLKKGRKKLLIEISSRKNTTIIYESPHRILKTLNDIQGLFGERDIVVSKELTKIYESNYRGSVSSVIKEIMKSKIKGEFVIIINGEK
tara:strand:+ start:325 stop:996 length:672 start_codon:yes stop_codon:yes gene_type:complete